jgi:hypothetical protein
MAVHGKGSAVLLGELNFSGYLRGWEVGAEFETEDRTPLGSEGHGYIPGLDTGSLSLEGMFDDDATSAGPDATLKAALGTAQVITLGPGGLALGDSVHVLEVREQNYGITSPVAAGVDTSASWTTEGQVDQGYVQRPLTSSAADDASIDNGAATSTGGVGHLHVTANTRDGTADYVVQHSTDDSVWVDLVTFTQVASTTTAVERVAVTGTVNRYTRSAVTLGGTTGSVSAAVAFARR